MNHKEIMNDMLSHPELIEKYLVYMSVVCNTLVQDSEMYNSPISELLEDFAQISQAVAIQEKILEILVELTMITLNNKILYSADELNDKAFKKTFDTYIAKSKLKYCHEDDFLNLCYMNDWHFYENGERFYE